MDGSGRGLYDPSQFENIPDKIPHTRQGMFDLIKFLEFTTDRSVYEKAWELLKAEFSGQVEILTYLTKHYVDEEEKIVPKWAAHQTCKNLNFGMRTTSSTERQHRKVKTYLKHGMGDLLHLAKNIRSALEDTARAIRLEEGDQITSQLVKYNGQDWLGELPARISRAALDHLARSRSIAQRIISGDVSRGACTDVDCDCPTFTQYGLICPSRLAYRLEAGSPLDEFDVHPFWWLNRDLIDENPLLALQSPDKVTNTRGRPTNAGTFSQQEGIDAMNARGKGVVRHQTASNTRSITKKKASDRKAGDKTRATSSSVQRIISAFEHDRSTLPSLDEEDEARRMLSEETHAPKRNRPTDFDTERQTKFAKTSDA